MDIDKKAVGIRIANIRDLQNKTLEEFGNLIDGATKSNVSKWEKGDVLPNRRRLKRIAEIGETSVGELLYGDFQLFCFDLFKEVDDELIEEYTELRESDAFSPDRRHDFYLRLYKLIKERNASYEDMENIKKIYKAAFISEHKVEEHSALDEFDMLFMHLDSDIARILTLLKKPKSEFEDADEYNKRKKRNLTSLTSLIEYLKKEVEKII
ncbi:helix-turn-helix domain-containing protein [Trichococcus shcherbakoviae]|uniref:HTH cro/C1-type domain-containing protein n=1 Tax=Trichococcus shcherbakoviae TaxID=2094020 RepID=A0A383TE11_9LACT|nr:helix-turn-helix transcriptional regulator [Trichococcus shcherbakoviae]SYZ78523.1 Hypothetical protein TART1_1307 [Trichococcus shcherbakoviae]